DQSGRKCPKAGLRIPYPLTGGNPIDKSGYRIPNPASDRNIFLKSSATQYKSIRMILCHLTDSFCVSNTVLSISIQRNDRTIRRILALYKRKPGFNCLPLAHILHMMKYSSKPVRRCKNVICACIASIIDDHDLEPLALRL